MNVICSAVNFGLGPTGKLCSIINACPDINWYLCGDKIDEYIFKNDVFKKKKFTRNKNEIKKFIDNNNIKIALVVLDGELANIYKGLGLKVIYVDSLPFLWQESDLKNGDVPLNVDYYCAQINYNHKNSNVLDKAKNLINVGPILPTMKFKKIKEKYDVIVNLGGLNNNGRISKSYIDSIMPSIINYISNNNYYALITCGLCAKKYIDEKYISDRIITKTLEHEEFLNTIYSNKRIITIAGLTTILEISKLNKKIILLPPNNLSQYYNQDIAKKLLKEYKILTWKAKELSFDYLKDKLKYGEGEVIEIIQKQIKNNVNKCNFYNELSNKKYKKNQHSIKIKNGTLQIKKIIYKLLSQHEKENALNNFINSKKYVNKKYFYVPYIGDNNFSLEISKLKKARDYMINDILKIDNKKMDESVEYNLGHGNPASSKVIKTVEKNVHKLFETRKLSKYNSALGSNKLSLLDFVNAQNIFYDNKNKITLDNIIPTFSVTHAFDLVLKSICRKHDVVLFTSPCYGLFAYMPERIGAESRFIKLYEKDKYIINPNSLKKLIIKINQELKSKYTNLEYVPRVIAFVNENPHNPIGSVLSKKDLNIIKELNKVCYEQGTFIIDDLVYQGTEYDENMALPCAVFPKYFSNIITIYGTSKTFNIPGVRLGFILANNKIIYEIRNQIFYTMDSYSLLNEDILCSIFNKNTYKSMEQIKLINHNVNLYKKNYNIIKKVINSNNNLIKLIPGINPKSGFFAILDFTQYKYKKYKNYTIKTEKDLLCFLYEYGNIRFITGESMSWPNSKQLIGRITYSDDSKYLKLCLKILLDTLSLLR